MSKSPLIIPLPERGLRGIQALIALGTNRLVKLAERQADRPLNLSFPDLFSELSEYLECDQRTLQQAFMDALIPLNGLRRSFELPPNLFTESLTHTLSERAPEDWRKENLEKWSSIRGHLSPFFKPDNFFSQASKAFELLSLRPAILQHVKILTELRPIYDEDLTKTLTTVQTNTLVLTYWDGEGERTLHVTLDRDDLQSLSSELQRAQQKTRINESEFDRLGVTFLAYGN